MKERNGWNDNTDCFANFDKKLFVSCCIDRILKEKYSMNHKIENVLREHNISRLCHMTEIDKFFSILYGDTGILANYFYDGISRYRNDLEKRDG